MTIFDQHYTNETEAKALIEKVNLDLSSFDLVVEPSAGMGAFSNLISEQKRLAFDIDPKLSYIEKQDFLLLSSLNKGNGSNRKILFLGNPPFGYRGQGAISFFNHSALLGAETIAFVLPRSFRKAYLINQLNNHFFLKSDINIDEDRFESGTKARCCFQVWERDSTNKREKIIHSTTTSDLSLLTKKTAIPLLEKGEVVAIRRTAFSTKTLGEVVHSKEGVLDILNTNKSTQFILLKINSSSVLDKLKEMKKDIQHFCIETTTMSPTISGGEIIDLYQRLFGEDGEDGENVRVQRWTRSH